MTKGYKLLGYKLADNIFYCLHHREIITLRGTRTQVQLRSTMACLLEYLLAHGRERLVSDEELMINVWEKNNLRPSAQRLWQVIQSLKSRLHQAGVELSLIHISEPTRLGMISYAVFCLKKKKKQNQKHWPT